MKNILNCEIVNLYLIYEILIYNIYLLNIGSTNKTYNLIREFIF